MQQQINIVWSMFYIINNFNVVFCLPLYHNIYFLDVYCSFLRRPFGFQSSVNLSFSFEHDHLNQLLCSVLLIWLK